MEGVNVGAGFCDPCRPDAFPVNLSNVQCFGLTSITVGGAAASSDACRAACCGGGSGGSGGCTVWQWCGGVAGDACVGPACWVGEGTDLAACSATAAHAKGWVSQGSEAPPCT